MAAEGVVTGYPDGTFGGDKLMTRYEMAQIVAKAMANGANVDKLAAEFADELDSLGVRVANLEKKADNVKITGQVRLSYRDNDNYSDSGRLRTRLFLNGAINEDWTYTGRFENNQYYHDSAKEADPEQDDDEILLNWAYVSGRVGGVKLDAGRQNFKPHTGNILDTEFDGAKLSYGKNVKLTGYVGSAAKIDFPGAAGLKEDDRLYIADLSAKLGAVDAYVSYYNVDNGTSQEIWNVGASVPVVKDLALKAEYMNGSSDEDAGMDNEGYVVGLAYKGAKAAKVGSWGLYANYYDMAALTYLNTTNDAYNGVMNKWQTKAEDGFEGYEVGANVTLAKNIVAGVKYFDLDSREGNLDEQAIWSEVVFTF